MENRTIPEYNFLKRFLENVRSYTEDLIYISGGKSDLYHYTDLNALLSIIKNNDLWLTHSKYSNDDEEMLHGYGVVEEVIEEQRRNSQPAGNQNFLDKLSDLLKTTSSLGVYICCFCLDDNLLSQWRAYGANGTGVSIKFNASEFNYITGPDSPTEGLMRLWKVFYEKDRQKAIIREAINFAQYSLIGTIDEQARQAFDAIQFFIPTFKNADFAEEKECRLIFTPSPITSIKPRYRIGRGMLIPYYSLAELSGVRATANKLPITSLRLGPGPAKQLNVESTKMMLIQHGFPTIDVNNSTTPYRG